MVPPVAPSSGTPDRGLNAGSTPFVHRTHTRGAPDIYYSWSTGLEGTLGWTGKSGFELELGRMLMAGTNERKTTGSASATEPRTQAARRPSHDEIAMRAFQIYLSRGKWPGRNVEDWLEAERQLLKR